MRIPTNRPSSLDHNHLKNNQNHPSRVPLPPSPPATDPLDVLDPIEPAQSSSNRTSHPVENVKLKRLIRKPIGSGRRTRRNDPIYPKTAADDDDNRPRTRKRLRDRLDATDSPPSSPTARKSVPQSRQSPIIPTGKRLKSSRTTPSNSELRSSSPRYNLRDSARNPFLARSGEKPRRAGARKDDEYRKLVYVFRGKRIQYDCSEELDGPCGESPFSLSKPRLLFPSTPPPIPQQSSSSSSSALLQSTPTNNIFQTPKKPSLKSPVKLGESKRKGNSKSDDNRQFLLTPQSKPRTNKIDKSRIDNNLIKENDAQPSSKTIR